MLLQNTLQNVKQMEKNNVSANVKIWPSVKVKLNKYVLRKILMCMVSVKIKQ